jgi:hypothetical protein
MLQQADEEQLDGRRKIKGLCETRWSSRADTLNIYKSAHALIIDTLDDLGTGGDRNAMQLKLAPSGLAQTFYFSSSIKSI